MAEITLDRKTDLKTGNTFTIGGQFKKRTFWQWLFKPKELQQFTVTGSYSGGSELSISPTVEVDDAAKAMADRITEALYNEGN